MTAGSLGAEIADAARDAFVRAMSTASIVVACVAVLGAVVAWRYLPRRGEPTGSTPDARVRRTAAACQERD